MSKAVCWVLVKGSNLNYHVKGSNLNYHNKETILFTIDPYYGDLNYIPQQEPSLGGRFRGSLGVEGLGVWRLSDLRFRDLGA